MEDLKDKYYKNLNIIQNLKDSIKELKKENDVLLKQILDKIGE